MELLVITGPTASGKSSLAVECAKLFNGEIISADSMQIYKGMDIGTAKVTTDEMQGIKHHLIDIVEPQSEFSVSDYITLAKEKIAEIKAKGKLPIIAGGTGLYIKSLLYSYNFANSPKDPILRENLEKSLIENGNLYMHEMLSELDSEYAKTVHPNASKRVIRAIEIIQTTGRKLSEIPPNETPLYDYEMIVLNYKREQLYDRINQRVDTMLKDGVLKEIQNLLKTVPLSSQSFSAIGYKEFLPYLNKTETLENVVEKLKQNTRNYAKRQITYFKSFKNAKWFEMPCPKEEIINYIKGKIHE